MGKDIFKLLLNLPTIIWIFLRWFASAWAEEKLLPFLDKIASWLGVPMIAIEGFLAGVLLVSSIWWLVASVRKKHKMLSPIEMQNEIKHRKKYLPEVKSTIAVVTDRIEYLANDARLYDIDEYRKEYPIVGWHFKRIAKVYGEMSGLEGYLWTRQIYADNLLFRRIQDDDMVLREISLKLDNLYTEVRDKKVKIYIKNIRKALHIAYSYIIFNKLSITHFKTTALKTKLEYKHKRNTIETVRELQNELNSRIKELLEGAEDEQ